MASPGAADERGDPADGPPDRARRQAPDLGDVAVERRAVDPELVELLVEQVRRDAVEEQLDREDDDDEVVEAADDRDVVGDEVPAEDEVAGRAGRAAPCARPASGRRSTSAETSRAYIGDAAGERQERHQRQGSAERRRHRSPAPRLRLLLVLAVVRAMRPLLAPLRGSGVYQRSHARRRPTRRPLDLDIERPFGMMHGKEARVTKHDAERKVKILDFIAATLRARGYPPSVREIARAVGLASTSAVHHHLQILEREGYLERGAAQSRAIRLTPTAALRLGLSSELVPQSTPAEARVLPIIGEIAAGGPIEAYQDASETHGRPGHPRARAATPTSSGSAAIR